MRQLEIAGVKCLQIENLNQVIETLDLYINNNIGTYSVAINAEKIIRCQNDPSFTHIVNSSKFQIPDGVAALLLARKKYKVKLAKIDLPRVVLSYCNENKNRLSIIGSNEFNNKKAYEYVNRNYQDIVLCGRLNGYNSLYEIENFIRKETPQIILFGLGSPKQEIFSKKLHKLFPTLIIINSGGAIDVLSGVVKRAPTLIQELNLEWLYRLIMSPSRFKRQIKLFKIIPVYLNLK